MSTAPRDILIVGAGVFGLSTALSLLNKSTYDQSRITIIDSSPILPNPVGSSVDSSRIIRADYAQPSYARLACLAQEFWRDQSPTGWGGQGRYSETGLVLTGDGDQINYVKAALLNVKDLADRGLPMQAEKIRELHDRDSIRAASGLPGIGGDTGYANWNSGWSDAEKGVAFALHKIKNHSNNKSRITVRPNCKVDHLQLSDGQCTGVELVDGERLNADLTILATGAWTPSLFNLSHLCVATGQTVAYIKLTPEENTYLEKIPVLLNLSSGLFVMPPRDGELKVARHGYGYRNPESVHKSVSSKQVSVPKTDTPIPSEGNAALRVALKTFFPPDSSKIPSIPSIAPDVFKNTKYPASLSDVSSRPFTKTRICWYTDTPTGNFLVDYPPLSTASPTRNKSLFLATGGSGHGYKFLPILGDYIVDAIEGNLEPELAELWKWEAHEQANKAELAKAGSAGNQDDNESNGEFTECHDGSRGGPKGMLLQKELGKDQDTGVAGRQVKAKL